MIWSLLGGVVSIVPVYFFLDILLGNNSIAGRAVPKDTAMALLVAIPAAAILPNVLGYLVSSSNLWCQSQQQCMHDLRSIGPVCQVLFVSGTLWIAHQRNSRSSKLEKPEDAALRALGNYGKKELQLLNVCYRLVFAICSVIHMAEIAHAMKTCGSSRIGLTSFLSWVRCTDGPLRLDETFYYSASLLVYLSFQLWELRRQGYIETKNTVQAVFGIALGQILLGPGAVYVATWQWREGVLAGLEG